MTCLCRGFGILRLAFEDGSPDVFVLCACADGQAWREDRNAGRCVSPAWTVWAAEHQVRPEQIALAEEVLDELELAQIARESRPTGGPSRIADAMRTQRPRL